MAGGGFGSGYNRTNTPGSGARSGGFGSRYQPAPTKKKGKKRGGFGGFVHNLADDVRDTAVGIGPGVVRLGSAAGEDLYEGTVGTILRGGELKRSRVFEEVAKPTGKQYAATYGPLFRGDYRKTARAVYDHPLGPILDVTAILTGGTTAATRAGLIRKSVPAAVDLAGPSGKTIGGRVVGRGGKAADKALKKLPANTWAVGEMSRFAKELDRVPRREAMALEAKLKPYAAAHKSLSRDEKAALKIRSSAVSPDEYKAFLARERAAGAPVVDATLRVLDKPSIRALVRTPTPKLARAEELARDAGKTMAEILTSRGLLDEATVAERPFLHARLVTGAKFQDTPAVKGRVAQVREYPGKESTVVRQRTEAEARAELTELETARAAALDKLADKLGHPSLGPGEFRGEQARRNTWNARVRKAQSGKDKLGRQKGSSSAWTGRQEQQTVRNEARTAAEDELYARMEHNPDHPTTRAWTERDERINELRETLNVFPDPVEVGALGEVAETVAAKPRRVALDEREAQAASSELVGGRSIEELKAEGRDPFYMPDVDKLEHVILGRRGGGAGVPRKARAERQNKGYLFRLGQLALDVDQLSPQYLGVVKRALYTDIHELLLEHGVRVAKGAGLPEGHVWIRRPTGKAGTPERIPHTETTRGQVSRDLEDLAESGRLDFRNWFSEDRSPPLDVAVDGGFYVAMPKRVVDRAAGEFTRSEKFTRLLWENPTKVWRALTLGLRVGFVTNNVIGNHFLYVVRQTGRDGLKAYVNALRTMRGRKVADAFDQELMAKYFPEQVEGLFWKTQVPKGAAGKLAEKASAGVIPATQAFAEGTLRRATTERQLRRHPAVKARLRTMPKETRSFVQAAKKELDTNPTLAREVSQKVNATLGDYLSLSPAERGLLRGVFPFYAWYKAIVVLTVRLPVEAPFRTEILAKLSEVGQEWSEDTVGAVPSYLEGSIPWGEKRNGILPLVATRSLNPYATTPSVLGAAGSGQDLLGSVNPIALGLVSAGSDMTDGKSPLKALLAALETAGRNTPQARLGQGPSDLYPQRSFYPQQLLAYLGIPYKEADVRELRRRAAEGR